MFVYFILCPHLKINVCQDNQVPRCPLAAASLIISMCGNLKDANVTKVDIRQTVPTVRLLYKKPVKWSWTFEGCRNKQHICFLLNNDTYRDHTLVYRRDVTMEFNIRSLLVTVCFNFKAESIQTKQNKKSR